LPLTRATSYSFNASIEENSGTGVNAWALMYRARPSIIPFSLPLAGYKIAVKAVMGSKLEECVLFFSLSANQNLLDRCLKIPFWIYIAIK